MDHLTQKRMFRFGPALSEMSAFTQTNNQTASSAVGIILHRVRLQVDAAALAAALRRGGARELRGAGGAELARALLALRDARVSGRMPARDVPALLRVLAGWRAPLARAPAPAPALRLRALLRAAGVAASNKVLEGCVLRFAPRAALRPRPFLLALARIHLAHGAC